MVTLGGLRVAVEAEGDFSVLWYVWVQATVDPGCFVLLRECTWTLWSPTSILNIFVVGTGTFDVMGHLEGKVMVGGGLKVADCFGGLRERVVA